MFATAFVGLFDPASGMLSYVNAGHEAPAVVSDGGQLRRLPPTGPALGLRPDMAFSVDTTVLAPGETFVAFTDGVTDAQGPGGDFFTEERLLALIERPAPSAEALLDRIGAALAAHRQDAEPFDDVTVLAVRCEE